MSGRPGRQHTGRDMARIRSVAVRVLTVLLIVVFFGTFLLEAFT